MDGMRVLFRTGKLKGSRARHVRLRPDHDIAVSGGLALIIIIMMRFSRHIRYELLGVLAAHRARLAIRKQSKAGTNE
jgi:hypothetical protein